MKSFIFVVVMVSMALPVVADAIRVETREGRRSCGEETQFRISYVDDKGNLKKTGSALVMVDNFGPAVQISNRVDFAAENPIVLTGTLKEPGFLRVSVDMPGVSRNLDGRPYMYSVPYEHDKIVQGAAEPTDFDAFWAKAEAELASIPIDVKMTEVVEKSCDKWTMYRVSFASIGRRVNGWMSIPKKGNGPWPARVNVPGAGCDSVPGGNPDQVQLRLSVFPYELSMDGKANRRQFDALNAAYKAKYGVPRYPFAGMDVAPREYFYYPVIIGAARAVRWLATRPEVDRRHITYSGESQGGAFGLYLAGTAGEVFESVNSVVPALTDTLGWLKGRDGGWPHPDLEWFGCDEKARDARIAKVMPYFDCCNFAARAKCPVRIVAGLADWVCPPSAVCAAYNRISRADCKLLLAYGGTHHSAGDVAAEQEKRNRRRPQLVSRHVAPEDADYLRRKFREDVTGNGLGLKELAEGGLKLAKEKTAAGVPWQVAKAEVFAWMCDNMGVAASEHDFFPAISAYARWGRPMTKVTWWRDEQVNAKYLKKEAAAVKAAWQSGRFSMWKDFDHSVPDWDELFAGGWPMIERRLKQHEKPTPYYQALRITLDACLRTVDRFAAVAREAAGKASNPAMRARLEKEAAAFAAIRAAPPRTVYEVLAFQFSYFFLSEHLDGLQVRSLGALDQLLAPYYRADLAAGRITTDEFKTLLAHYWWQWGSIDNYWGQPVALGGTNKDGTSAYNEVSDLILDVHDELALPTPKMIVKVATNTPDRVLGRMLDLARRHRSITFDGEETMTKILKRWRGCTDEECRTCDLNGCYEFYVHGAQNITQSSHISFLQPVHDILARYAEGSGGEMPATFDAFKAVYFAELKKNTLECCDLTDAWERYLGEINPGNVYSLAVESAIRDQKDAFYNGLKYNDTALLSVGLGTAVDALLAVKEIVYESGILSLPQLGALMKKNWKGGEELRMRMLRSKRKWGVNNPEANALGTELAHTIGGWVNGRRNCRGGIWGFSGHPAKQFIVLMAHTGATPDGRLAGEESSKNVSATMGMDTEGVTALINTLSHLDPCDLPVNLPLDVMMHPSSVQGPAGLAAMRSLARVYFANGGTTLQFNIFDVEELKDAQKHPEKYENLQVRVCGWNVRWNDLPKSEQDKYIARAENIVE